MAWRDSRSQRGRLAIFSLAIVSGIAALVAIHSLKASVQTGIETQAKALLGSDLQISSRRAFPAEEIAKLSPMARSVSRETSFSSMLYFPAADAAGSRVAIPFMARWRRLPRTHGSGCGASRGSC
jgi:putative ABC transport system permease protein